MKRLKHYLLVSMTLFTVNSFSQMTHTFTLDNTDMMTEYDSVVQVGDIIEFVNGYDNGQYYVKYNTSTVYGPQTVYLGSTFYTYTVPNWPVTFDLKGGTISPSILYELIHFTVIESSVGIVENTLGYSIYPNPTTDYLNIDGVDVESVKIFDMSGRLVIVDVTNKVDLSGLKGGFYIVSVNDENPIKILKN